jgi:hypothetical protein
MLIKAEIKNEWRYTTVNPAYFHDVDREKYIF